MLSFYARATVGARAVAGCRATLRTGRSPARPLLGQLWRDGEDPIDHSLLLGGQPVDGREAVVLVGAGCEEVVAPCRRVLRRREGDSGAVGEAPLAGLVHQAVGEAVVAAPRAPFSAVVAAEELVADFV